jgi:hypothetical protein
MVSAVPPPNSLTANKESIFFVSLPKSGTVFTWNMLEKATGLSIPRFHELEGWHEYSAGYDFAAPHLYACGDYNTQLLRPQEMPHYARGYIFGAHMQASYHNTRVLNECGIQKITVLLRDPRDSFVSWVHHLRQLGPTARDYHSKIYGIPRAYYDWSLAEQFAFQIRTFLPTIVNWVEGWLDYYASADRQIDVLFVYYDELKRDPKKYITRILAFHEFEGGGITGIMPPTVGTMHYRKGEHGQWREEFTPQDQDLAASLMQDRIFRGFEAAAASQPDNKIAKESQQSGRLADAATATLRVLAEFPNYSAGYARLAEIADAVGVDTSRLKSVVASTLTRTPEDQFIYRDELLQISDDLKRKITAARGYPTNRLIRQF